MKNEVTKDVKLKDYLESCIEEISSEYIASLKEDDLNIYSALIQKHREMLLSVNEICKKRNRY